jgi:hypothetical protein
MGELFVVVLGSGNPSRGDLRARSRALTSAADSEVMTKMRRATGKFNRFNSRI